MIRGKKLTKLEKLNYFETLIEKSSTYYGAKIQYFVDYFSNIKHLQLLGRLKGIAGDKCTRIYNTYGQMCVMYSNTIIVKNIYWLS